MTGCTEHHKGGDNHWVDSSNSIDLNILVIWKRNKSFGNRLRINKQGRITHNVVNCTCINNPKTYWTSHINLGWQRNATTASRNIIVHLRIEWWILGFIEKRHQLYGLIFGQTQLREIIIQRILSWERRWRNLLNNTLWRSLMNKTFRFGEFKVWWKINKPITQSLYMSRLSQWKHTTFDFDLLTAIATSSVNGCVCNVKDLWAFSLRIMLYACSREEKSYIMMICDLKPW